MPVLVVGAHTELGQVVVRRLCAEGGQVRAVCPPGGDPAPLRAAGAFVATCEPLDEGRLEAAMTGVHTVVHLGLGIDAPDADHIVEVAASVLTAALGAGARRLITLSVPGAAVGSTDPLRRAAGTVEELLAEAPLVTVALRCSLVDTAALRGTVAALREAQRSDLEVAPLRPADLAEALTFLDALRSTAEQGHATLGAAGPQRMPLRAYAAVAAAAPRRWRPPTPLRRSLLSGPWLPEPDLPDVFALAGHAPQPITTSQI